MGGWGVMGDGGEAGGNGDEATWSGDAMLGGFTVCGSGVSCDFNHVESLGARRAVGAVRRRAAGGAAC